MVEKLIDKLKELPAKFMAWWNKFTTKVKTAIIFITVITIIAFAILISVITRPSYTGLVNCDTTKDASEVKKVFDEANIDYKVSTDGMSFSVNTEQLSDANILLGENNITGSTSYGIDNVTAGGFSTTEADKQKRYIVMLEKQLEEDLKAYSFIRSASVNLHIPEDDGTLIADKNEASAGVQMTLSSECSPEQAAAVARFVATSLGNETTEQITLMDTDGNMLFAGGDELTVTGSANSQLATKQAAEAVVKSEVRRVLLGTNEYDLVEVASNLSIDFSSTEYTSHEYKPADDQSQGLLSSESSHEAESSGGTTGVPGTDSNGDDTYMYSDSGNTSSSVSDFEKNYLPNEILTSKSIPPGLVNYQDSSVSVAAIAYKVLKEEDAKSQGLLDGISWDEYKLANEARVKMDVDPDFYGVVSKATGVPEEKISIVAYEEPFFVDKEASVIDYTDVIQIVLIVVILALLAYVVFRSMKSEKTQEQPEELSVESMLQSMPEEKLDDIELETKSETRKQIEKFVDENPEAVANLLRNWLNEDWG